MTKFKKINLFLYISFFCNSFGWSFFGSDNSEKTKPKKEKIVIIYQSNNLIFRDINQENEAHVTEFFANELKKYLDNKTDNIEFIITNDPNNDLNLDGAKIYINLFACKTKDKNRFIDIYFTSHNPNSDYFYKKNSLTFLPLNQSYKIYIKDSINITKSLQKNILNKKILKLQSRAIGVPIKFFNKIIKPQISIELGLYKKEDYKILLKVLCTGLEPIIQYISNDSTTDIKPENYDKTDLLPLSLD